MMRGLTGPKRKSGERVSRVLQVMDGEAIFIESRRGAGVTGQIPRLLLAKRPVERPSMI